MCEHNIYELGQDLKGQILNKAKQNMYNYGLNAI